LELVQISDLAGENRTRSELVQVSFPCDSEVENQTHSELWQWSVALCLFFVSEAVAVNRNQLALLLILTSVLESEHLLILFETSPLEGAAGNPSRLQLHPASPQRLFP
jgi:hypothetical protein